MTPTASGKLSSWKIKYKKKKQTPNPWTMAVNMQQLSPKQTSQENKSYQPE